MNSVHQYRSCPTHKGREGVTRGQIFYETEFLFTFFFFPLKMELKPNSSFEKMLGLNMFKTVAAQGTLETRVE